jgi:hypothetical protein
VKYSPTRPSNFRQFIEALRTTPHIKLTAHVLPQDGIDARYAAEEGYSPIQRVTFWWPFSINEKV